MPTSFEDRIAGLESRKTQSSGPTRPREPGRWSPMRLFWTIFGGVWGFSAMAAVNFSNANYDRILTAVEAKDEGAGVGMSVLAFGPGSLLLIVLLLVVWLIFFRKNRGFRLLLGSYFIGMIFSNIALSSFG